PGLGVAHLRQPVREGDAHEAQRNHPALPSSGLHCGHAVGTAGAGSPDRTARSPADPDRHVLAAGSDAHPHVPRRRGHPLQRGGAEDGPPVISSSAVIERDPSGEVATNEVCGGLVLDLVMGSRVEDRADMTLLVTNNSEYGWR